MAWGEQLIRIVDSLGIRSLSQRNGNRDSGDLSSLEQEPLVFLDTGFGVLNKKNRSVGDDDAWSDNDLAVVADGASSNEESRAVSQGIVHAIQQKARSRIANNESFPQAVGTALSQQKDAMLKQVKKKGNRNDQLAAAFVSAHFQEQEDQLLLDLVYSGDCEAHLLRVNSTEALIEPSDYAGHLRSEIGIDPDEVRMLRDLFGEATKQRDPALFFYQESENRFDDHLWRQLESYYSHRYGHSFNRQLLKDHMWNKRSTTYGMYSPTEKNPHLKEESIVCPDDGIAIILCSDGLRKAVEARGSTMENLFIEIRQGILKHHSAQTIVEAILNALQNPPDDVSLTITVLPSAAQFEH